MRIYKDDKTRDAERGERVDPVARDEKIGQRLFGINRALDRIGIPQTSGGGTWGLVTLHPSAAVLPGGEVCP